MLWNSLEHSSTLSGFLSARDGARGVVPVITTRDSQCPDTGHLDDTSVLASCVPSSAPLQRLTAEHQAPRNSTSETLLRDWERLNATKTLTTPIIKYPDIYSLMWSVQFSYGRSRLHSLPLHCQYPPASQ